MITSIKSSTVATREHESRAAIKGQKRPTVLISDQHFTIEHFVVSQYVIEHLLIEILGR